MQTVAILEINSKTPIDFDRRTIRSLLVVFEFPHWISIVCLAATVLRDQLAFFSFVLGCLYTLTAEILILKRT